MRKFTLRKSQDKNKSAGNKPKRKFPLPVKVALWGSVLQIVAILLVIVLLVALLTPVFGGVLSLLDKDDSDVAGLDLSGVGFAESKSRRKCKCGCLEEQKAAGGSSVGPRTAEAVELAEAIAKYTGTPAAVTWVVAVTESSMADGNGNIDHFFMTPEGTRMRAEAEGSIYDTLLWIHPQYGTYYGSQSAAESVRSQNALSKIFPGRTNFLNGVPSATNIPEGVALSAIQLEPRGIKADGSSGHTQRCPDEILDGLGVTRWSMLEPSSGSHFLYLPDVLYGKAKTADMDAVKKMFAGIGDAETYLDDTTSFMAAYLAMARAKINNHLSLLTINNYGGTPALAEFIYATGLALETDADTTVSVLELANAGNKLVSNSSMAKVNEYLADVCKYLFDTGIYTKGYTSSAELTTYFQTEMSKVWDKLWTDFYHSYPGTTNRLMDLNSAVSIKKGTDKFAAAGGSNTLVCRCTDCTDITSADGERVLGEGLSNTDVGYGKPLSSMSTFGSVRGEAQSAYLSGMSADAIKGKIRGYPAYYTSGKDYVATAVDSGLFGAAFPNYDRVQALTGFSGVYGSIPVWWQSGSVSAPRGSVDSRSIYNLGYVKGGSMGDACGIYALAGVFSAISGKNINPLEMSALFHFYFADKGGYSWGGYGNVLCNPNAVKALLQMACGESVAQGFNVTKPGGSQSALNAVLDAGGVALVRTNGVVNIGGKFHSIGLTTADNDRGHWIVIYGHTAGGGYFTVDSSNYGGGGGGIGSSGAPASWANIVGVGSSLQQFIGITPK